VHGFSVSLDGRGAGADQSAKAPLGAGGELLHGWVFETAYGRTMVGQSGGSMGVDDAWLRRGDEGVGATVMGRNMFGPVRGPWPDGAWRGWWGEEPPYHHDVFVLTHHARDPLVMAGGTTFRFVDVGLDAALVLASEAAGGADVRIGGGVSVVREALDRGLVDELHLAVVPVALSDGEPLVTGTGAWPAGYLLAESAVGENAQHLRFTRV
jgi:dihydrofolate reductase